jgi:hypothetical protein
MSYFFPPLSGPSIEILSDSAKHVEHQSALNLTCVVDAVASDDGGQQWPKMVWYKDGKVSKSNACSYCRRRQLSFSSHIFSCQKKE